MSVIPSAADLAQLVELDCRVRRRTKRRRVGITRKRLIAGTIWNESLHPRRRADHRRVVIPQLGARRDGVVRSCMQPDAMIGEEEHEILRRRALGKRPVRYRTALVPVRTAPATDREAAIQLCISVGLVIAQMRNSEWRSRRDCSPPGR